MELKALRHGIGATPMTGSVRAPAYALDHLGRALVLVAGLIICLSSVVASNASALSLDANIAIIFVDTTGPVVPPGLELDPNGDTARLDLQPGNIILITIDVANPEAELIRTLFATLTVQGDQLKLLSFFGAHSSILMAGPLNANSALLDVGTGDIKANSPSEFGSAGDVWLQTLAYARLGGTNGTGPDRGVAQYLFEVTGASGNDEIIFELGFTDGDGAVGASEVTFNNAVINPIPEPHAALLIGLGLAGLSIRGHRPSTLN